MGKRIKEHIREKNFLWKHYRKWRTNVSFHKEQEWRMKIRLRSRWRGHFGDLIIIDNGEGELSCLRRGVGRKKARN